MFDDTEPVTETDIQTNLREVLITDDALGNIAEITSVDESSIGVVGT